MKNYTKPTMEEVAIELDDVILTSITVKNEIFGYGESVEVFD